MSRESVVMKVEDVKLLVDELKSHADFEVIEEKDTQFVIKLKNLRITCFNMKSDEVRVLPQGKDYQAFDEAYGKVFGESFDSDEGFEVHEKEILMNPKCIELNNQPLKKDFSTNPVLKNEYLEKIAKQVEDDSANGYAVIFTDGSNNVISNDEAIPSYGAVIYTSEVHTIKDVIFDEAYRKLNNYAGEVIAVLKALEFCEQNNIKKSSFFVDSTNTLKEFYGCYGKLEERKKLNPLTLLFNEKIKEYKEKGFEMKFSWCPGHISVPQNEAADALAREAFDEYMASKR